MIRYILISFMMTLFCECQTNQSDEAMELNKQQIGITSIHNARQLADRYRVQCIYDFRGQKESMTAPDVIPGDSRYMNLSISLDEGGDRSAFNTDSEAEMMEILRERYLD